MSGSDSDLDFESAEEDTEFVSNTKVKVSHKTTLNDEPSELFSTEGDALSAVSDKISTINLKKGTNKDESISVSSEQQILTDKKETVGDSDKFPSSDKLHDSKVPETDGSSNPKVGSGNAEASVDAIKESDAKSCQIIDVDSEKFSSSDKLHGSKVPETDGSSNPKVGSGNAEASVDAIKESDAKSCQIIDVDSDKFSSSDKLHDSKVPETDGSSNPKVGSGNAEASVDAIKESDAKSCQIIDSAKPISEQKGGSRTAECASELQSDKSSQKVDQQIEESKTRKERVVLRLEKKLLSKESPVESEKPSDFVNILKDPTENKQQNKQSSSWGFSGWGSSLLSSAASSVSTFSTQVSQGIGTVLETVESTLGAPSPEELAQTLNEKKAEATEVTDVKEEEEGEAKGGIQASSWSEVLENAGAKVLMGGLDVLEQIGKRTMDTLTQGDPGLRDMREVFSGSNHLRFLKEQIEARQEEIVEGIPEDDVDDVYHYTPMFDEKQGTVHLEALEILSKQSEVKLQRLVLRHSRHIEVKKRLEEIKQICVNIPFIDDPEGTENFQDFEALFKKHTLELSFSLDAENFLKTHRELCERLTNYENVSEDAPTHLKELYKSGVGSLAHFTAKCMETFHKAAELILVQPNLDPDLEHCARNLTGLTAVMCVEVNHLAFRYHKCLEKTLEFLKKKGLHEEDLTFTRGTYKGNALITFVYIEATCSYNYIKEAYRLLVPVLQVRFLEAIN